MKRVKISVFVLLLIFFTGINALLIDGLTDDIRVSDVGIVLGSKVMPDGLPSDRLRARLDGTSDLYQQGMFKKIIVSGGTGKERYSEARVMADYLSSQKRVPSKAIILDEHGDTTQATARNSVVLMKERGLTSALVVTQYFHITSSRYALHQAGITAVHTAHPHYFEWRDLYSIAREAVALQVYWINSHTT